MIVVAKLTARAVEEVAEGRARELLGDLPAARYRMARAAWTKDHELELTFEPVETSEEPEL